MRGSQKTDEGWFEDLKAHVSERLLWSSLASEPMDHFLGTPLPVQIGHTLSVVHPGTLGAFRGLMPRSTHLMVPWGCS